MIELVVFALILLSIFGFVVWATKRLEKQKSIGDLMNEQHEEVLEHVETANQIKRDTPVAGAARRVSDRWDRANRSLLDRRTANDGQPSGHPERRNGAID